MNYAQVAMFALQVGGKRKGNSRSGQVVHSLSAVRFDAAVYVPAGQGNDVGDGVPSGQ